VQDLTVTFGCVADVAGDPEVQVEAVAISSSLNLKMITTITFGFDNYSKYFSPPQFSEAAQKPRKAQI